MEKLSDFIYNIINMIGVYGPILACVLILFESIIPIMPLALFITINFLAFGNFIGFIISWVFTVLGCIMSFILFRKGVQGWFQKLTEDRVKLNNLMIKFNNISLTELTLIIAIPFTPAFLVNIAAGLSKMPKRKFIVALLIGKLSIVYFWGYIGTSLVESLKNPVVLIKLVIIMILTYVVSLIVKKITKI
jgi:uncharacterized membrane protein YdjX (TVP38/TMEM64 family)